MQIGCKWLFRSSSGSRDIREKHIFQKQVDVYFCYWLYIPLKSKFKNVLKKWKNIQEQRSKQYQKETNQNHLDMQDFCRVLKFTALFSMWDRSAKGAENFKTLQNCAHPSRFNIFASWRYIFKSLEMFFLVMWDPLSFSNWIKKFFNHGQFSIKTIWTRLKSTQKYSKLLKTTQITQNYSKLLKTTQKY